MISPREVVTHPHPVVLSIRVPTLYYKVVISIEETLQVDFDTNPVTDTNPVKPGDRRAVTHVKNNDETYPSILRVEGTIGHDTYPHQTLQ